MNTLIRMLAVCCFCAVVSCVTPTVVPTTIFTVPEKKDLSLLTGGTPRDRLIQEFGSPAGTYTDRDTGALHDVFRFRQGSSRGARWGMLAGNLAAMSVTGLGAVPSGTSMAINVEYDDQERVLHYRPVQ